MEQAVAALFDRYERLFAQALAGEADMEDVAALYASDMIAAAPAGVMTARNDEALKQAMAQGYERYRAQGTRSMRVRQLRITQIDALHCLAHVGWRATYARSDLEETAIDFDVHYLVQLRDGEAKVFGWITGDEEAELKRHGVI
ncbi:DUF6841 family protein [Sinisalibacter aestuarii]|uniref:DUF6841 domain-containing protein n=1 Tax=Sinisalibacter aestuarii TaxID=2949426 RepID=A0ABQ5LTE0_9RHOB|nr:nuclear transport factor 2 family protein [Sinisalibacter aestuarii]GKY88260.1 hypothetical protein STA1M1_21290 [Sinisalibacter aestuarii]